MRKVPAVVCAPKKIQAVVCGLKKVQAVVCRLTKVQVADCGLKRAPDLVCDLNVWVPFCLKKGPDCSLWPEAVPVSSLWPCET